MSCDASGQYTNALKQNKWCEFEAQQCYDLYWKAPKKMMEPIFNDWLTASVISSCSASQFKNVTPPPGHSLPQLNKAFSHSVHKLVARRLENKNVRNAFLNLIRLRYAICSSQRRLSPRSLPSFDRNQHKDNTLSPVLLCQPGNVINCN